MPGYYDSNGFWIDPDLNLTPPEIVPAPSDITYVDIGSQQINLDPDGRRDLEYVNGFRVPKKSSLEKFFDGLLSTPSTAVTAGLVIAALIFIMLAFKG